MVGEEFAYIIGAFTGALFAVFLVIFLALYVYSALALMTIGKKLKKNPTWLAWVPIANMFYLPMLAGYDWYYGFLWLLSLIPIAGLLVQLGLIIWWFWKISEARKKEGWFGILMIIPIVNLVILGILAWSD